MGSSSLENELLTWVDLKEEENQVNKSEQDV